MSYPAMGAMLLAALAALHLIVWRTQRTPFSCLFALAFLLSATAYALDPWLLASASVPNRAFTGLRAPAMALLTWGIIDYVGLAGRARRHWRLATAAWLGLTLGLLGAGLLSRTAVFAGYALVVAAQAALVLGALRREPRSGHLLLLLALMAYEAAFGLALSGQVPVPYLRYLLIVPVVVLGMTVLATSLLRTQQRLRVQLERAEAAEAQVLAANAELEHRVRERTAELQQLVQALESFNSTVSHDLRGPIGGIAGLARLAHASLQRGDPAPALRALPVMAEQAESSVQLMAALLSLARAGRGELHPQPVDLDTLLASTLEQLRLTDTHGTALRVMRQAPLPTVEADPALLRQVWVNLLSNAAKFCRDQPVPLIEVGMEDEAGEPVFYVRDNGVGFDAARAAELFEPFRRLHGQRFDGHGVGLSIVKRIVERHGGRVWADGRAGEGATFRFTLSPASKLA